MPKKTPASQQAAAGERMIQVNVRLWTSNIAKGEGNVIPKHAWTSGVVRMETNTTHGIKPRNPVPFHTLMNLSAVIERVLIAHGIVLHLSPRAKKYMATK
jgi:hypothetical protein